MTESATEKFNASANEIKSIIERRKNTWTLSTMEWDDVASILLTRIWQKFHLYDPKQPLENWCNRVISRAISNLLRDNLYCYTEPCITAGPSGGKCVYNIDDGCQFTPSGKKCAECPLYAKWEKKKKAKYNIQASLSLEHHSSEVSSMPEDFIDFAACKKIIDEEIPKRLSKNDAELYRILFVENMSAMDAARKMEYKIPDDKRVPQIVKKKIKIFKKMAKAIIIEYRLK